MASVSKTDGFYEDEYSLILNEAETEFLAVLLHRVGGSPTNSARKYSDSIIKALRAAGSPYPHDTELNRDYAEGAIIFSEYKTQTPGYYAKLYDYTAEVWPTEIQWFEKEPDLTDWIRLGNSSANFTEV